MVSIWKYERDELQNYLILYLSSDYIINDFEMKMCLKLKNSFLMPIYDEDFNSQSQISPNKVDNNVDNVEITTNRVIKYPISNVILLSKYLENSHISFESILEILEKIVDIYYMCIDYLLIPEQVLFDMDKIFIDFRTNQIYMIYVPIENFGYSGDFKNFLTSYFNKVMKFDGENVKIYSDISKYCNNESFCMEGFKNILSYYKKEMEMMRRANRDYNGNSRNYKQSEIEEYEEEEYFHEGIHTSEKDLKSILIKSAAIYCVLLLFYILAMRNAPVLFGNSFEISLLIGLLFLALAIYLYIKFIHCDILEFLEVKKRIPADKLNFQKPKPHVNIVRDKNRDRVEDRDIYPLDRNDRNHMKNRAKVHVRKSSNSYMEERDDIQDFSDMEYSSSPRNTGNKYCETEILQPAKMNYLINLITGEKIYLTKNIFKIGRHEEENDYVLEDRTVGRFHAQFDIQKEDVSVTDLGSKNGTYINENRIYPYTKSFLSSGDIIKLAGVSFSFNE